MPIICQTTRASKALAQPSPGLPLLDAPKLRHCSMTPPPRVRSMGRLPAPARPAPSPQVAVSMQVTALQVELGTVPPRPSSGPAAMSSRETFMPPQPHLPTPAAGAATHEPQMNSRPCNPWNLLLLGGGPRPGPRPSPSTTSRRPRGAPDPLPAAAAMATASLARPLGLDMPLTQRHSASEILFGRR